jgi:hypothetical protein
MDGIPGGTGETVPFDWLGDGLPMLVLLLAAVWIVHRVRTRAARAAAAPALSRRGWKGFATRLRRGRSPA